MIPRRYILLFHQAALGDFLMTWPLAMAMGRVFAQSRVMYVTGPDKGRLAEAVLGVEWVGVDTGWHALHADGDVSDPRILRLLQGAQCLVLFAQHDEPTFVRHVRTHAGNDVPLIHIRPNPPAGVHVMRHQLDQLEGHGKLGGYVEQMQTLVRTTGLAQSAGPSAVQSGAGTQADRVKSSVLIHPGSGAVAKNWPIESYLGVAAALRDAGETVTFVIGEVERERWDAVTLGRLRSAGEVAEPDTLLSLRNRIGSAAAFIGNDSGPTHLAAMLGVPTVALFGPASSAAQWRPIGPRVTALDFDAGVTHAASAVLACRRTD